MDIATKRGRLRDRDEATSWLRMRSRLAETTASPWELFPLREACTDYAAELAGDDDGRNDDPVDPAGRPRPSPAAPQSGQWNDPFSRSD